MMHMCVTQIKDYNLDILKLVVNTILFKLSKASCYSFPQTKRFDVNTFLPFLIIVLDVILKEVWQF